jgi:hypothetical protein
MNGFVWKPQSEKDGNLTVLFPATSAAPPTVYLVTSSGQLVEGRLDGRTNGNRPTYRFPDSGDAYGSNVTLVGPDDQVFGIGNSAQRYDDGNPPTPIRSEDDFNSFVNGEGVVQTDEDGNPIEGGGTSSFGNNIGTEPNQGFAFPQADFSGLGFERINPLFIPRFEVPVVDPIERTGEVGDFNRLQNAINLRIGSQNALDLTQLEFTGLELFNRQARDLQAEGITEENVFNQGQTSLANQFNREEIPAANIFNRGEISAANDFNQTERLDQLETAMPGAADAINRQIERGSQLAEGRFVTDAEDRAFEVASRSASADGTVARGFGDDSVFGRRASEMLSAEQRLGVSQIGEQTLDRFLRLGANLSFDQPIKQNPVINQPLTFEPQIARTSQDVRGAPSRPASDLAVQQQFQLDNLSTITPTQAIAFDINQNQFQGRLDREADIHNSNLDFEAQRFNSTTGLQVELEQLYGEVFNAQQESNAINAGIGTGIAQDNFETGIEAGQNSAILGALGTVGGAIVGNALNNSGGNSSGGGTGGSSSGTSSTPPATTSGGTSPNTSGQAPPATSGNLPPFSFDPDQSDGLGDDQSGGGFGNSISGGGGSSSGGAGSGQRTARRTTGASGGTRLDNNLESAELVSRAVVGRDPAARRELSARMGSTERAAPSSGTGDTAETASGTASTLTFFNDLYNYQDQYEDLSDEERTAGAAQLATGAAALAGVITGPTAAIVNAVIESGLVASQWNNMSSADQAAYIQNKAEEAQAANNGGVGVNSGNAVYSGASAYNWDQMSDYEQAKAGLYAYTAGTAAPFVELWEAAFDTFGVSFSDLYSDAFGSNKSKDQQLRDAIRDHGEDYGLFVKPDKEFAEANNLREGSHHVQLADGGYYDIGRDGGHKLPNYATNIDGKDERNTFDVDWSDPRAGQTVGMVNPLAYILYGEHAPKFVGHLTNAATSNNNNLLETKKNVRHMAESTGITYEQGLNSLKRMFDNGEMSRDVYDAYLNGWSDLMLSDGVTQNIVI